MSIDIQAISKRFGAFTALDDVNLHIGTGELVALLGPSGCGKTTLLRIIAGLEQADEGYIHFEGVDATHKNVKDRRVGFVFQHYALFKHMTVFDNVAFGLQVRPRATRPSKAEIREKVMELLRLVQLDWTADRYPSALSGGQRQRVALARALAVEPRVLLLDEPFGALDARVRRDLRRWLRRLHDELHITSVFVTHDQEEALEVADRVAVLNKGRVEQVGTPDEVYDAPATPFVYEFLGEATRISGKSLQDIVQPENAVEELMSSFAFVRPRDVDVSLQPDGTPALEAIFRQAISLGPSVRVELQHRETGETIEADMERIRFRNAALKPGQTVYVRPRAMRVFNADAVSATR